jgi:hypothetical protein
VAKILRIPYFSPLRKRAGSRVARRAPPATVSNSWMIES